MTTAKPKLGSLSVHRPTPQRTVSKSNGNPRTPFSFGAITPAVGNQKRVWLSDWWLTKKKNNGLGIEGFESEGGSVVRRVFSSGPISKRLDSTTLQTSDGITVSISGFFNKSSTLHNGFSLEVCNRFLTGFPYNWRDYDDEIEEKSVPEGFSIGFDDIPVSRLDDLLLTPCSSLKSDVLDDVVDSLREFVSQKSKVGLVQTKVVGVKTRAMLKRGEDDEGSIAERLRKRTKKC